MQSESIIWSLIVLKKPLNCNIESNWQFSIWNRLMIFMVSLKTDDFLGSEASLPGAFLEETAFCFYHGITKSFSKS